MARPKGSPNREKAFVPRSVPIRKNVTLGEKAAHVLESVAGYQNMSQGLVLEIALSQPLFRMTQAFFADGRRAYRPEYVLAELVRIAGRFQDRTMCEKVLKLVLKYGVGTMETKDTVSDDKSMMRHIAQRMPEAAKARSEFMQRLYDDCQVEAIYFCNAEYLNDLVGGYVNELLKFADDESIFGNRNMYEILSDLMRFSVKPNDVGCGEKAYFEKLRYDCIEQHLILSVLCCADMED